MRRWGAASAAAALAAAACAGKARRVLAPDFQALAPARVAVLPFDNESVDLVAPELLRRLAAARVRERGYETPSLEGIDERLKELGVTDGGQLRAIAPGEASKALGADGLLYGVVEEFTMQNVGFVLRRVVRLRLRLVRGSTGAVLWEDSAQATSGKVAARKGQAGRIFVEGLLERMAGGLFQTPLMGEATKVVERLVGRLPARPAAAVMPVSELSNEPVPFEDWEAR